MTIRSIEHRGCRLAYDVAGSGPPVLLVQGVGVHGPGWAPQVAGLESRFRCLSFDNRGIGRSQPRGERLSVERMAEDARALMEQEGWTSAHVVGHSLGGLVALHLALSARPLVRSLALLCTFARGGDATRPSAFMLWAGLRSRVGTRRSRRRAFLEIVMPREMLAACDRELLAERLAPLFGHDLADHPPIELEQLGAARAYDCSGRLGELSGLPTLVLSAAHDPISPPSVGRALAAAIPGARFVEWDDASHGAPIQHADRLNALLLEHLGGAEKPRR